MIRPSVDSCNSQMEVGNRSSAISESTHVSQTKPGWLQLKFIGRDGVSLEQLISCMHDKRTNVVYRCNVYPSDCTIRFTLR